MSTMSAMPDGLMEQRPAGPSAPAPFSPGEGAIDVTERERELGAIVLAYNDVTERLKDAHDRLTTEVSRLQTELGAKNEALRRSERLAALGEMAAGLAHEIRNPLGAIALYASRLERDLTDRPAERQAATKISSGVRSLDRLVSEILDFAQEDRLDRAPCSFDSLLAGVMEHVGPWLADSKCSLQVEASSHGAVIDCDRGRLEQVLSNLLINGVQAAGRGGVVTVRASDNGAGAAEIEVCDNGPGIAPDAMNRIFNPFFTTKASGTGLGLAIVHRIVEAHGGTIAASNREEGGARFVVTIPPPHGPIHG